MKITFAELSSETDPYLSLETGLYLLYIKDQLPIDSLMFYVWVYPS